MPRTIRPSYAILWLCLVHVLADVAVGVYRVHDLDRGVTDTLTAALSRGQLCLLAIWLAVGGDPLSWRLCGLLGGGCLVFVVFSRTALPGHFDVGGHAYWLEEEWAYYFRLSAPGDLLVKAPILVGGLVLALAAWRLKQQFRDGEKVDANTRRRHFQFGLSDAIVWVATISLVLTAMFRTAPYEGWLQELATHWRQGWRPQNDIAEYARTSAVLYVGIALAALWLVYGKTHLGFRAPGAIAGVLAASYGFEEWLHKILDRIGPDRLLSIWAQASSETASGVLTMAIIAGSLMLYRLYRAASLSDGGGERS